MRTIGRYGDNEMLKLVLSELNSYLKKQKNKVDIAIPTLRERYLIDIALSANNITECFDQIHFSIGMLSGYRKRKDIIMTRHDYIVFMIENVYLRLTSIFDRALRLTNLVFNIGLPERECKESTIIQNSKIKGTSVASNLKKVNKAISKYRKIRNQIAHSETYNEKSLVDIQGFYLLGDDPELEKYQTFFKRETDDYIRQKKTELKMIVEELERLIMDLFDSMEPHIKRKVIILK